ncbi:MAG: hypothetical protein ACOYXS_08345, partial [Chloroflexota bacterium]
PTDPPVIDPPATDPPAATEERTTDNPPATERPAGQDKLPQADAPTGEVLGAVSAPRPTPRITLPPTDTLAASGATPAPVPVWRFILVGLAGFIVSLLLLSSDRTARRRS